MEAETIMNAIFAALAIIYLIVICVNFDSVKRSLGTQVFITVINMCLIACAAITDCVFLLVTWSICLVCNCLQLKWKINGDI